MVYMLTGSVTQVVTIVLIVVLCIVAAILLFLFLWGRKQQRRMDAQQDKIEAASQNISMLVIDKKKVPLNKSGLPQMVIDSTPRLFRRSKVPLVKAKVGPKVLTLVAENNIFDMIPLKQEIKATVSGIYITSVKSVRGPALKAPAKKKGLFRRR